MSRVEAAAMRRKAKDATAAREMLGAIPPLAAMLDEGDETVQTGGMARRVAARPAEVRLAEGRCSRPRSRWNSHHWKRASSSAFFFFWSRLIPESAGIFCCGAAPYPLSNQTWNRMAPF